MGLLRKAVAATITALFTFSRGANPPFAVAAASTKVANLDVDKVDGYHATNVANQIPVYDANTRVVDSDKLDGLHSSSFSGAHNTVNLYQADNYVNGLLPQSFTAWGYFPLTTGIGSGNHILTQVSAVAVTSSSGLGWFLFAGGSHVKKNFWTD